MSAVPHIIAFPVQYKCPTCSRACAEEDLSQCLRCGQRYCRYDSWECICDRDAADMVERGTRRAGLVEGLLARFRG